MKLILFIFQRKSGNLELEFMLSQETEKYFSKNKTKILRIFKKTQLLESWLYMKVAFNESLLSIKPKERARVLNAIINKPMGFYIEKYKKLYPEKKKVYSLLKITKYQRDKFMHILYTWCLLHKNKKEMEKNVNLYLDSFERNLDKALDSMEENGNKQ